MRLWIVIGCLGLWGCGDAADAPKGSREVEVALPPASPGEPAAGNTLAAVTEVPEAPAPEAGFETVAAPPPHLPAKAEPEPVQPKAEPEAPAEVEVAVAPVEAAEPAVEGTRPAGSSNWAAYIRKARFQCDRVTSIDRVDRAANPGFTYYRVQCGSGATYQATDKRGHLFFRRWTG